jgi:3-deoxy-D-manno-octulosonic-acid transferase
MRTLYSISIYIYNFSIRIAALFLPKAKLWVEGRKNIFERLSSQLHIVNPGNKKLAWFHCASLGEFEQGRPLLEKYRKQYPDEIILLTFFSPSGYEIRKNYKGADLICYLPIDTPSNAKLFLDIVKPSIAFFIKYEFWFNYLNELKIRNIPVYLVSGIFRQDQHFFKSYGGWFKRQLRSFTHFFLQDEASASLLASIGFENADVVGDTRFDRVSEIVRNVSKIELVEKFKGDQMVFICGSTWQEDEKMISVSDWNKFKIIIAPHEINEDHLSFIEAEFSRQNCKTIRFSQANALNINAANVLIIDNIGMLSSLYQYGSIAFIGGGFGKGIHNILEAATFGLPVIFGPNYHKFNEAKELIKSGGAFSVSDTEELNKTFTLLKDGQILKMASHVSKHYVQSRTGASDKILSAISKK